MKQFDLFNQPTGEELRDIGIKRAVDHADKITPAWSEMAYKFLTAYIRPGMRFLTEEVRVASKGVVPDPPHFRAWGGIIRRAAKNGLIRQVGYGKVKNPQAHMCFASVWYCDSKS